jgi:hypothetical protein
VAERPAAFWRALKVTGVEEERRERMLASMIGSLAGLLTAGVPHQQEYYTTPPPALHTL